MQQEDLGSKNMTTLKEFISYAKAEKYEYIWAWQIDQIMLGKMDRKSLDLEKLIEARIFSLGKEIHIFQFQDEWKAVETKTDSDVPGYSYQDEIQLIEDKKRFGSKLTLRHYIDFEQESGQAYVACCCLNGWEE